MERSYSSHRVFKMLNRRTSLLHTFICVTATALLVAGCSSYIYAQDASRKAETQPTSQSEVSSADMSANSSVSVLQNGTHTGTDEPKNETQTGTDASQAATSGTEAATSGTEAATNGTQAGTNGTKAATSGTQTATSGTQASTNGTQTGKNGTQASTNETQTGTNGTQASTNGTQATTNGTQTETNSTESDKTNQTAGGGAHEPQPPSSSEPPPLLSIFFVNDLQYDIFPIHPENGSFCTTDQGQNCVGGLPSLKSYMNDACINNTRCLWLNAGNTLGGDFFRTLKFETALHAMQLLNFSATAVGPNVLKYGGEAGRSYIDALNETVVVSNIEPSPPHKSITFPVGSCNVSVIGYLENSELDADIHGVSVKNYTQSIIGEIERIHKEQNASNLITVVIGSSSINKSRALASIDGVDFVFFSGANLSEGAEPNNKDKQNNSQYVFWETVDKKSANKTATAYVASLRVNHSSSVAGRFIIGQMQLPIANSCRVANASFKAFDYVNSTADKRALDLIKLELRILQKQNESLTKNNKNLTAERDLCCHSECSLGNLITDAMVAALQGDGTWSKNGTRIGMYPAKYLKPNSTIPEGNLTELDIYGLIENDAYIYSVLLTGQQLKDTLEISINSINNSNSTDFLHVSGFLQIEYRQEPKNSSKIAAIKTVSAASASMLLSKINVSDATAFYNVSVPLTLLKMDSYKKLVGALNASFHLVTTVEAVTSYINSTVILPLPAVGGRLVLLESSPVLPPLVPCKDHTATIVIVTLIVAALVVGLVYGIWRWRSIRSHLLPGYINF
ncbi:5'-nucleotidase isoform X2 [Cryptotermes secundus]|uniref:5'-nucleotidase isoform X2 n=1 Tax=Cryptotermes secundus TaxID=105785 RepID=UPI000CD7CFAB|nr:5'-nucleotidase isoform X2 [Cryptotermes secundus]